ncbi:stage VI sporulation protein D [Bacillus sp. FJAT-47783]|uniref:stage VI sporulation protein D n=1 Tax=Bacillus sp. FJAT-47783 TaxID=2922712 RepID=UPI001FADD1B7
MPQDHASSLRFSVEESVWFQKGQEVHELLSISLEPDISIREHDQYVSIKGALQLEGEYKMDDEEKEEIDRDPYQFSGARFLQHVETREDGVSELVHHFPVDITIPRNRVTNLEDVYVTVESFDYDFLEERCLKLMADITILGIREEEEVYSEEVDETEDERELETEEESGIDIEEEGENETGTEQEEQLEPLYRSEQTEDIDSEIEPTHVLSNMLLQKEEEDEDYSSYIIEAKQKQEDDTISANYEKEARYEEHQEVKLAAHEKPSEEASVEQKHERKNDNSLYLTKLFTREDEEEFSKLKMCIVQRGDTVEEICHRYDITVQQLIRINNLEADPTVYDGQILYIPVYVNH